MSKRAVLYARVSGDDRNNSTSSLEGQIDLCREYANEQGWQIVAELSEDKRGASGADWNLPQLNKALDLARAGEFDILVTRELDRLARSLAKQLVLETEFNRLDVIVKYALGNYEDSIEGNLSKQIRAVIAEYERLKISERMVRGRRRKAQSGYVVLHGNVTYGYTAVKDDIGVKLEIDETTAKIVRMIFEWYTVNGWGTPTICRELNRLGIPCPSVAKNRGNTPKGAGWNQSQVGRILKNESYIGQWRYGKRNKKGKNPKDYQILVKVPAIIDDDVFALAQELRRTNRKLSKRNIKYDYLLARRCYCGSCQAALAALTKIHNGTPHSYYRCPVPHSQGSHFMYKQCDMRKHFRGDYWDNAIWQEIKAFLSDPAKLVKGVNEYRIEQEKANEPLKERLEILDEILEQKRDELNRLLDLYLSGQFDMDLLNERKHMLEGSIKTLQEEWKNLKAQMTQMLTDEQINELELFSKNVTEGLIEADEDFATRRKIVDYLGTKVFLSYEDGTEVASLYCEFGQIRRFLTRAGIKGAYNPSLPLQSEQLSSSPGEGGDNCRSNYKHSMDCTQS